jgi:hypothetical protein
MLTRRPLNKKKDGQTPAQGNQQPKQRRRPQQPKGPQAPGGGPKPQRPQQSKPQGSQPKQGGQGGGNRRRSRRRGGSGGQPRRPVLPPAYIQRDLLLVPTGEAVAKIEEVRAKFDPLAKKVPAHVTLLFPEPANLINKDFLKSIPVGELPSLGSLTFSSIIIHDDMYLWLIPDDDSGQKLKAWQEAFIKNLATHSQEEKYEPHITLGYVPRKTLPEDAIGFAKNLISLPLTLNFEKLLLEEFGENQISTPVESLSVTGSA